ncbi:alpha/beta hydrolase [Pseudorhodobacter sp. E13]|uniref:alpha/beta hydrolase n=1 Tax=Pseudorhodobacter sp. E13 TaxID=2487931 RepID=UPI000F8D3A36|nr:alpha/beta hydrolase [Pseudorhodobacter sp. E13]RUS60735.1 alpha/beta hydrolase [Pseudorhodobacter sp. E13]
MDMDLAYANGAFIAGAADYPPKWQAEAAAFRAQLGPRAQLGLAYGPGARQAFDLFLPETPPRGCVTFIHGGYWMAFDRSLWSHFAAGVLARGWACAMPSYTLAPEARIAAMTAEMGAALAAIGAQVPGPQVVTGHSAGGHLSARMGCADLAVPGLVRVVPISPLSDLDQIAQTKMQEKLHLDAAEIAAESPARLALRAGVQAHVWVGGQERPSFLWQARLLSEAWSCDWTVSPGKHHFDVIDALQDANSPLVDILVGGL